MIYFPHGNQLQSYFVIEHTILSWELMRLFFSLIKSGYSSAIPFWRAQRSHVFRSHSKGREKFSHTSYESGKSIIKLKQTKFIWFVSLDILLIIIIHFKTKVSYSNSHLIIITLKNIRISTLENLFFKL